MMAGEICTVDFYIDLPALYASSVLLFAGGGRRHPGALLHLRLDR